MEAAHQKQGNKKNTFYIYLRNILPTLFDTLPLIPSDWVKITCCSSYVIILYKDFATFNIQTQDIGVGSEPCYDSDQPLLVKYKKCWIQGNVCQKITIRTCDWKRWEDWDQFTKSTKWVVQWWFVHLVNTRLSTATNPGKLIHTFPLSTHTPTRPSSKERF